MDKFSIKDRQKSFTHAFNGIRLLFKHEHNSWIHLLAVALITIAGFYFDIAAYEWIAVILCFGIVLMAEAFNSSIEALADKVTLEKDPQIKVTKDIAAGAVLLAAIMAIIVACIIFIPKILVLI